MQILNNLEITIKTSTMKKIYLILTMITAIGLLVFIGCSKEAGESIESNKTEVEPGNKDLLIESRILDFKSKIDFARENPNLKSGDDLSIEEAVYNIEALANYSYADANTDYEDFITETAEVEVPLTNGNISLVDAGNAYDDVVDNLSEQYNQIPGNEKQLLLSDISVKSVEDNTATLNVTGGYAAASSPPTTSVFGTDDYWWFGQADLNMGGYCDGPYQGTQTNSDAAEQIEHKIMVRRSLPSGHRYFIDIKEVQVMGNYDELIYEPNGLNPVYCYPDLTNPDDQTSNDNYYDKLIYFNTETYQNFHGCLEPSEMNFYLNGMEDIIYDIVFDCFPNQLSGKIFSECDMGWGLSNAGQVVKYYHTNLMYYGNSVGSSGPPTGEL